MKRLTLKNIAIITGLTILIGIITFAISSLDQRQLSFDPVFDRVPICTGISATVGQNQIADYFWDHPGWPFEITQECSSQMEEFEILPILADLSICGIEALVLYFLAFKLVTRRPKSRPAQR